MADVWAAIAEFDAATQGARRASSRSAAPTPSSRGSATEFLAAIDFPRAARVLDVGCGTGVLTPALAARGGIAEAVGVDVAPVLLERARALAADLSGVAFVVGDAGALPCPDQSFDVVGFDSTLCHVPAPDAALAEAFRVLRPGGWLGAFDGDYATTSVALGDHDPLQRCAEAMMAALGRRSLARAPPARPGARRRAHGGGPTEPRLHQTDEPEHMLTIVDRGCRGPPGAR